MVEGKCDHRFIDRVTALRFQNAQLSIIAANSDNRIKEVLTIARGLFSDIQRSPYRDRIFVVLDSVHTAGLPEQLVSMGLLAENIIKWPQNGIEHFYPPILLDKVFGTSGGIEINGDRISRNGVTYTKNELVEKVVALLEPNTPQHAQFEAMFLQPLAAKIG